MQKIYLFLFLSCGWLAGLGTQNDNIYKFTGNFPVGISDVYRDSGQLRVCPNPSSAEAIPQLPASWSGKTRQLYEGEPDLKYIGAIEDTILEHRKRDRIVFRQAYGVLRFIVVQ